MQGARPAQLEAAAVFAGEALVYLVTGGGASIDAATGRVSVPTGTPVTAEVRVTATNSGGSASVTFNLTVTIDWPDDVAVALWPAAEVTSPTEAANAGFPNESGRIKAAFGSGIDNVPAAHAALDAVRRQSGLEPCRRGAGHDAVQRLGRHARDGLSAEGLVEAHRGGTYKLAGTHPAITLGGLVFPSLNHPRTALSSTELATIRSRVQAQQQPQRAAYNSLISFANSSLNFTPHPDASYNHQTGAGTGPGTVAYSRGEYWDHAKPAFAGALAYRLTGTASYADKAVQILNAWAVRDVIMQPVGGAHPGLHIGSFLAPGFMYTVDLLRGYAPWEAVHNRFEDWWRHRVMPNMRAVLTANLVGATPSNHPSNWKSDNWVDAAINGLLATGIAFEDTALRDEMIGKLEKYFVSNWRIFTDNVGPGGTVVAVLRNDINRVSGNEITGISYTGYGTSSVIQALAMAEACGTNLWNRKTPDGVGYQEVVQQWFNWTYLNHAFHHRLDLQASGYTIERETRMHSNILEIADSKWNMSTAFKNYLANNRPIIGCPRDDFPTLTRGDM